MAAVTVQSDFGALKNKGLFSIVSPSICHEVMGPDAMTLVVECSYITIICALALLYCCHVIFVRQACET